MALWFVAVVVLIAVGAMPSMAQAHAGSHAGPHHGIPSGHIQAAAGRGADSSHDLRNQNLRDSADAGLRIEARAAFATHCDGACCQAGCRAGASCCTGAGLVPEADGFAYVPRPGARVLARAVSARADIVPEALPKPPRSLV